MSERKPTCTDCKPLLGRLGLTGGCPGPQLFETTYLLGDYKDARTIQEMRDNARAVKHKMACGLGHVPVMSEAFADGLLIVLGVSEGKVSWSRVPAFPLGSPEQAVPGLPVSLIKAPQVAPSFVQA